MMRIYGIVMGRAQSVVNSIIPRSNSNTTPDVAAPVATTENSPLVTPPPPPAPAATSFYTAILDTMVISNPPVRSPTSINAAEAEEKLPEYESVANQQPPNYNQTLMESLADISRVTIEEVPVGSYYDFFVSCSVCCIFQLFGLLYMYFYGKSHAHRCGMISAVGLTLFLLSSSYGEPGPDDSSIPDDEYSGDSGFYQSLQFTSSFTSLFGYLLLVYGLLAYRQIRANARQLMIMASSIV